MKRGGRIGHPEIMKNFRMQNSISSSHIRTFVNSSNFYNYFLEPWSFLRCKNYEKYVVFKQWKMRFFDWILKFVVKRMWLTLRLYHKQENNEGSLPSSNKRDSKIELRKQCIKMMKEGRKKRKRKRKRKDDSSLGRGDWWGL